MGKAQSNSARKRKEHGDPDLIRREQFPGLSVETRLLERQARYRRRKKRAPTEGAAPVADSVSGKERNYWAILKSLKDDVNWKLCGPRRRVWGCFHVANIHRLIAISRGDDIGERFIAQQIRYVVSTATAREVSDTVENAMVSEPVISGLDPCSIGKDLMYTEREWNKCGRTPRICPFDWSGDEFFDFLEKRRKKDERDRARRRRKAAGAKPRRPLSIAKLGEMHGVSRRTIDRWIERGILNTETGEKAGGKWRDSSGSFNPSSITKSLRSTLKQSDEMRHPKATLAIDDNRPVSDAAPRAPHVDGEKQDRKTIFEDAPAAGGGPSGGHKAPKPPSSLNPMPGMPTDHTEHVDGARTDADPPRAAGRPPAAPPTDHKAMTAAGPSMRELCRGIGPRPAGVDDDAARLNADPVLGPRRARAKARWAAIRAQAAQDGRSASPPMGETGQGQRRPTAAPARPRVVYSALGRR